jgi:hypothetical protein
MLFLNFQKIDILKSMITETWLSRHPTVEDNKSGISTNNQEPLEPESTTNLGTSRVLVKLITCKYGAQIQVGSKSFCIKLSTSVIFSRLTDASMLLETRTRKAKQFKFITDTTVPTKDGRSSILTRWQREKPRD